MKNVLAAELRRAMSRRIVRLIAGLCVLGILIAGVSALAKSHRVADRAGLANQQRVYAERLQACIDGKIEVPVDPEGSREDFCRYSGILQAPANPEFSILKLSDILKGTTVPAVLIVFLLGASLIGAEWRANTVTTSLTWETNRAKLFLAKLAAAVIVCVGLAIALQVLLSLALIPAAALRGSTAGVGGAFFKSVGGVLLRDMLILATATSLGFAIGATGRNTAASLGIGFVYLAILEGGFLGSNFPWLRPWLIVGNAIVWVSGSTNFEIGGRSVTEAGLALALYGVVAAAMATSVFHRRDVT